jgi:hypothetical protein
LDDFIKATVASSPLNLIEGKEFRQWFTTNINKRYDELLEKLSQDDKVQTFCKVLVSALFLAQDDYTQPDPPTPSKLPPTANSSSSGKGRVYLGRNSVKREPSPTPLKRRESLRSHTKKRKFSASVEDAPESD